MHARHSRFAAAMTAALVTFTAPLAQAAEEKPSAAPSPAELERKLDAAQRRLDEAAREIAELSMSMTERDGPHVMPFPAKQMNRAMLGVNLGPRGENEPDDGVRVFSVSPGGAAAAAGLKAGDTLLDINGRSLQRSGEESPRHKLLAALREVKPGDKVSVRYRREDKMDTAELTARAPANRTFTHPAPPPEFVEFPPHMAFRRAAGVFGSAELAPLTPKLGQYFGTEKGLLVVRAPDDARLKLEDGDVIADIDGRTPSSAAHALRILGSYQSGETVKLNVLRNRKRMTFDVKIPESQWEAPVGRARWPVIRVPPPTPGTLAAPLPDIIHFVDDPSGAVI